MGLLRFPGNDVFRRTRLDTSINVKDNHSAAEPQPNAVRGYVGAPVHWPTGIPANWLTGILADGVHLFVFGSGWPGLG